jgi:uncharacterized protein (TIGR00730 family)
MMIKKATVYCASSPNVNQIYFDAAHRLGEILAKNNIELIFGGGAKGLMGAIADSVITNGGKVTGIMPHFMKEVEWQHKRVNRFVFVDDMAQRKAKLISESDALIALPGGCGTVEELFEAISLKRLNFYKNPIVIVNINGFYDPIEEYLNKAVDEKFMAEAHRKIWDFVKSPDEVLDAIENTTDWSDYKLEMAAVK